MPIDDEKSPCETLTYVDLDENLQIQLNTIVNAIIELHKRLLQLEQNNAPSEE